MTGMVGRFAAAIVAAVLCGCLIAAGAAPAQAAVLTDAAIAVAGNHHTDPAMIRAQFRVGAQKGGHGRGGLGRGDNGRLDDAALDGALKQLYATGLFADVEIARRGDGVLVTVKENPTIARLAFEGNKRLKDADLQKAIQSKAGGPLSRATVHNDVENIVQLYRAHGYFDAAIAPMTIKAKHGRVDLVFEIKEGDKLAVRQVRFVGNAAYPATKLKGEIKTGQTNFLSFLLDNDIYDADRIDGDCEALRRFYLAHGYADVGVRAHATYEKAKKGVVVTFAIDEGAQYRVGKVTIESDVPNIAAATLRQYLRTRQGDVYDADTVTKSVDNATMALAKSGHPFATVLTRSARTTPPSPYAHGRQSKSGAIDLVYEIAEGRRLYVERIDIEGNTRTRDEVIRREFDIAEGDPYNRALLDRAERRLKALGYFKSVKIETRPGSAPDRVVVDVAVNEQKTGTFSISGGYSIQAGALAQVSVGDSNLFGTGINAKTSVTYGQYVRGGSISVVDPYVFDQHISLGGQLFANQTLASDYQSFDSTVYGAKLMAGTPLTDQLGVQYTYSIYNQSLTLDPAEGTSSLPVQLAAAAGPQWVSSIGTSLTYSTLDNPKSPTSGVRAQFGTEVAGLGGAVNFARTTDDVRYYHEITGDVVGVVHAQGGYETPWGGKQLPLLDNFFGGPQLVRGFAPNGFGPRDITPGTTQDNVGGNVYWTLSGELQAPVPFIPADAGLKVALFADAGSLWANGASGISSLSSLSPSQQIANSQAVRASVGASLIWASPFGALRVDYAFPIAKQPYDVTQPLNFTAGGF